MRPRRDVEDQEVQSGCRDGLPVLGYAPGAMRQATQLLDLLRPFVVLLGRFTRSGAVRPLRRLLRLVIGRERYDRLRLGVWVRMEQAGEVDPLHEDILPLIEQLDGEGRLTAGAAKRLRGVALGIRAETRRNRRLRGRPRQ